MLLTGRVSTIVFRAPTDLTTTPSFSVLILTDPARPGVTLRAVGAAPLVQVGMLLSLEGTFTVHPSYGRQFHFTRGHVVTPTTFPQFAARLSGPLFTGIGPSRIASLKTALGPRILDLLATLHVPHGFARASRALEDVPGFGPRLRSHLLTTWLTAYPAWEAPRPVSIPPSSR